MREPTAKELLIRAVRAVAGDAGVEALFARCNLTEVHIPLDPAPDHWMSELWGHEKAIQVSRQLTVINADGRRTCNVRCYLSNGLSRIDAFTIQLNREVREALLAGHAVRDVVRAVGVSERSVRIELKHLRDAGLIDQPLIKGSKYERKALPPPKPAPSATVSPDERRALWDLRASIVDEGILKGQSNRSLAMAAEVSVSYVRIRRKLLFASGKLKPGRICAEAA